MQFSNKKNNVQCNVGLRQEDKDGLLKFNGETTQRSRVEVCVNFYYSRREVALIKHNLLREQCCVALPELCATIILAVAILRGRLGGPWPPQIFAWPPPNFFLISRSSSFGQHTQ